MALAVYTDGTEDEIHPLNGTDFQPEELQQIIGGYIELVSIYNTRYAERGYVGCLCDEDGRYKQLAGNTVASFMAGIDLVGTVLFIKKGEMK
jgi:hypothetical protein